MVNDVGSIHESMTNIGVIDEREMRLPLSAAQLGLWFAQKIDPANPIYNIGQSIEIHGPVDPSLFNAAVTQALIDTEALQVRFIEEIDGPRQVIAPLSEISIPLVDVSAELDPQAAAEAWMKADLAKSVDLLRGPLFRFALFKAAPARFFWYQRYHHVLIDGFGVVLFKRRVADIYTALVNKLPCSENPFGSLAVLLEEDSSYRASERFARDRRYWLGCLADWPEPVSLSGRPATNCSCFLRQSAHLPPSSAETLRSVAHRARAGLPQFMVGATALYLHRLTSAQDLVLGLPVTGRLGAVSRCTPGMLSNVLPLRLTVHPRTSVSELIEQVAAQIRRGLLHQRYRTEDLNRDLGLLAHDQKLFGTSINVMAFDHELLFAGHRTTARNFSNGPVQDLSIVVYDRSNSNELRIDFEANPALYSSDELANHQQRFLRLLEAIAANPSQQIGRLELLEPEERQRILVDWNDTACEVPPTTLPALFEAQVKRSPDATALVFEESILTYAQLNTQANRLAHFLIGEGIGPEDLVALALPRSIEMVVSLLAILKAGAAYLPLDPDYPAERLAYIVQDAQPAWVFTTAQIAHRLPDSPSQLLLDHPDTVNALARNPGSNPIDTERSEPLNVHNPAYVIYTSGSTGVPKGVVVTHQGVANYALWALEAYQLSVGSGAPINTPLAFDATVTSFFLPLLSGKPITLLPEAGQFEILAEEPGCSAGFSLLKLTPAHLEVLNQLLPREELAGLTHCLVIGGESLNELSVSRWRRHAPQTRLINEYGPTETVVGCTVYEVQPSDPEGGSIPIGRPIWNTRIYVLDGSLQPVPVGVPGELYIAGAGLARSYLNRAALSAERFVADPYGVPGRRMYRTGDVARWRADGVLDFLGRADHQVKIRGFRIEPGEIEAVLLNHPAVAQAAVIAREDRSGDKRLVGYVVPARGQSTDPATLRAHLGQSLPDYMVPAAIVLLDALPLTSNGKLDRKELPAPDFGATKGSWRAPRSAEEELLCSLFAETLGLPRVGIEDNFFELGGDSISSIELVSRARRAGLLITPRDIFRHQSVEALAVVASAMHKTNAAVSDIGTGPLPLTPIMRWLLERGGSIGGFSQSMLLQVPTQLREEELIGAVQSLLDHHDALRLRLVGAGESIGAWSLEIAPPGAIRAAACVRRLDVSGLDELAARACLVEQAQAAKARLGPQAGVMVQAVWFDAGAEQAGRLLLTIHHLAVDAVSWRILVPDLAAALEAISRRPAPALEPCGSSFRRWAQRLLAAAQEPARLEATHHTGRPTLSGPDQPITHQPLDLERDTFATARHLTLMLPADVTAPLLTAVPGAFHGRVNDVLLTALVVAVAGWRRRRAHGKGTSNAVLIDLEGHGREQQLFEGVDLTRTVGWFTSLFPVRLDAGALNLEEALEGGAALGQAFKRIKEQLRALPDGGLGYGLLRHLNPETAPALAGLATPQIGFNYLGRFARAQAADWQIAPEIEALGGGGIDPDMPFGHSLEVNAVTLDQSDGPQLSATWSWPSALLSEEEVSDLAQGWFRALEALVRHAAEPSAGGHTPSDFPLVALSQAEVDQLEAQYPKLEDILPLSPLQEGLLFHALYDTQAPDVYARATGARSGRPAGCASAPSRCRGAVGAPRKSAGFFCARWFEPAGAGHYA